ncbi:MAG: hypothetical protein WCD18_00895 [Thermosynechococcaceae cyanobacterium]
MPERVELMATLPTLPRWTSHLVSFFLLLLTGSGLVWFQLSRLSKLETDANRPRTKAEYVLEERQIKAGLDLLTKMPSLGFSNLIADWTFLNFLQYFGDDQARPQTGYSLAPNFFQQVVDRDPRFLAVYPYLSASVTLYAGQPQTSVRLIEQGAQAIPPAMQPDAYFLWQAKGTDELLFLGRSQDAQRSYEMAADWVERSPDPALRAIAPRSRETARFLASNPNSRRARVGAWSTVLSNAIDDPTRQFALRQIKALGGQISVVNGALQVKLPKED